MPTSAARLAANRANARRSTGPRTAKGKAASSRNALKHGAYAADDTLLALSTTAPTATQPHLAPGAPTPLDLSAHEHAGPRTTDRSRPGLCIWPHPQWGFGGPQQEALPNPHLTAFAAHFQPQGPIEALLVRRLAALATRLDLLTDALDALLLLDERHALLTHLEERLALNRQHLQTRSQPPWSHALLAYDGQTTDHLGNPLQLDPHLDPAACALAYTLSSPRAALLMRHEAAAERRFQQTLHELLSLQSIRRRSHIPPTPPPTSPNESLTALLATRAHQATGTTSPICKNEPNGEPTPAAQAATNPPCRPSQPGPAAAATPQTQVRTQSPAAGPLIHPASGPLAHGPRSEAGRCRPRRLKKRRRAEQRGHLPHQR